MLIIFMGYFTAINRSSPIRTRIYVDRYTLNISKNLIALHLESFWLYKSLPTLIATTTTYMTSPARNCTVNLQTALPTIQNKATSRSATDR